VAYSSFNEIKIRPPDSRLLARRAGDERFKFSVSSMGFELIPGVNGFEVVVRFECFGERVSEGEKIAADNIDYSEAP
jgi:hypothetical protein